MGKDIFISYRRKDGEHLALLIYKQLKYDGYSVFLDVESLREGEFDKALFARIREAKDFLLILPPHGMDRCKNPEDWVRQEIECAIENRKNIIPIMMPDFGAWPQDLPEPIDKVEKYNGMKIHPGYFDDMIRKLKKSFLKSTPRVKTSESETMVEDEDSLKKCPQCGAEDVICQDPLPEYVGILRFLRQTIRCWVGLVPLVLVVVLVLGMCLEQELPVLNQIGIIVRRLQQNPIVQRMDIGLVSIFHALIVMVTLLILGNRAYRYTENRPILEREQVSRSVTLTCKRCKANRRVHIYADQRPVSRNEKMEKLAGRMFGLLSFAFLVPAWSVIIKLLDLQISSDQFLPILTALILLALYEEYLISKINYCMTEIPGGTLMAYLKKDFHFLETMSDLEEEQNQTGKNK